MSEADRRKTARVLLRRYPQTIAQELKIAVDKNTPAPLFQLLVASLLFSARIPHRNAARAIRALIDAGLTTPRKMAQASWQERVDVITWHGYKRYDERTATMLGETAEYLLECYRGDLRRLRDRAARDLAREKELLTEFKGIGSVGADIFLREVQLVWTEAHPYADDRVLGAARKLGLGNSAKSLAKLVPKKRFAQLADALVRVELEDTYGEIAEAA